MLTTVNKGLHVPNSKNPAAKPFYDEEIFEIKKLSNSKLGAFKLSNELKKEAPLNYS